MVKARKSKIIGQCGVGNKYGSGCGRDIREDDEWMFDGTGNKWHPKCFYGRFGYID